MLCGFTPFWDGGSPVRIYENILKGKVKYPPYINPEAQDLLCRLITPDLTKRLGNLHGGAADIKNHAWFAEVTWDRLAAKDIDAPYVPPVRGGTGDASQFDRYPEEEEKYGATGDDPYVFIPRRTGFRSEVVRESVAAAAAAAAEGNPVKPAAADANPGERSGAVAGAGSGSARPSVLLARKTAAATSGAATAAAMRRTSSLLSKLSLLSDGDVVGDVEDDDDDEVGAATAKTNAASGTAGLRAGKGASNVKPVETKQLSQADQFLLNRYKKFFEDF